MINVLKFFLPKSWSDILKRKYYQRKYKSAGLMVGNGCSIQNVEFGKNVFLGADVQLSNCSINDSSYVNAGSHIQNTRIGKFSSIGPNVKVVLGNHPTDFVSTHPTFYANNKSFETFADDMYFDEYGAVEIGNDVWIGQEVMIPGSVKIGDGAVILPRAIVTKDVQPFSIVGGIPAKLVRYRFTEDVIHALLEDQWWNKDTEWLQANFKSFHNPSDYLNLLNKTDETQKPLT